MIRTPRDRIAALRRKERTKGLNYADLLELALLLEGQGDYVEASRLYEHGLNSYDDRVIQSRLLACLARVELSAGSLEIAEDLAAKAADTAGPHANDLILEALVLQMRALALMGDAPRAVDVARRMLAMDAGAKSQVERAASELSARGLSTIRDILVQVADECATPTNVEGNESGWGDVEDYAIDDEEEVLALEEQLSVEEDSIYAEGDHEHDDHAAGDDELNEDDQSTEQLADEGQDSTGVESDPGGRTTSADLSRQAEGDADELSYGDRFNVVAVLSCLVATHDNEAGQVGELLDDTCDRLGITLGDREELRRYSVEAHDPLSFAVAIQDARLRLMLMWDLLALAMGDGDYDAYQRLALRKLADALSIPWGRVQAAEQETALTFSASPFEGGVECSLPDEDPDRWWKIIVGSLAGGAALGLTGGLAAPAIGGAIGTYFMSLSGAAAVNAGLAALGGGALAAGGAGMAGGAAAVGIASGVAGAALVANKVARRTAGITEFQFDRIGGSGVHVCIGVSGFLSEDADVRQRWACLRELAPHAESFALRWESGTLIQLYSALIVVAGRQVAKRILAWTAASASKAAVRGLLPPTLIAELTGVLDNPWFLAVDRANKGGAILADALRQQVLGQRPISLVGFSLGSRLILTALEDLARTGDTHLVQHAVLMGSATSGDGERWSNARRAVVDRMVNVYSKNDYILKFLYRTAQFETEVAGLGRIEVARIENLDASSFVDGHLAYREKIPEIMRRVGLIW